MYPLNAIANWTSQVNHTVPNSPAAIWYEAASECPADDDGQRSGSESSSISVPPLAQPGDKFSKVARPPNAWILYRSDKLVEYRKLNPEMYEKMSRSKADRGIRPTQANMSKTIAEWWAKEPQSVKDHYHKEATARSVRHQAEYPGYRFNPNKCRKRKLEKKLRIAKNAAKALSVETGLLSPIQLGTSLFSAGLQASPLLYYGAQGYSADNHVPAMLDQMTQPMPICGAHKGRSPSLAAKLDEIFADPTLTPYSASLASSFSSSVTSPSDAWPWSPPQPSPLPLFAHSTTFPLQDTYLNHSQQATAKLPQNDYSAQSQPISTELPPTFSTFITPDCPVFDFGTANTPDLQGQYSGDAFSAGTSPTFASPEQEAEDDSAFSFAFEGIETSSAAASVGASPETASSSEEAGWRRYRTCTVKLPNGLETSLEELMLSLRNDEVSA